jgi:CBS domain containing-hemolysin-like protein
MHNPYSPPLANVEGGGTHRMKTRIQRFSPHQNAKVFAVLMAVVSFILLVPLMLFFSTIAPDKYSFSIVSVLVVPIVYLVFSYISVVIWCWLYNLLAKFTGGIEFDQQSAEE